MKNFLNGFSLRNILKKTLAAGLAGLLSAPAGAVIPAVQIGVAGGVQGKVFAFPPSPAQAKKPIGREILSGKPLYQNEKITTDAKGRMQIMLADETTFTLGPNSSMTLDEFVYDPKTGSGKVTAQVTKGVFRFVTGNIGHKDPSSMKVKFPTGTMGIRGTIVAGSVDDNGNASAVLLGPGPDNNSGDRVGAFTLENGEGAVDVDRPGFGSTMGEGAPPTPPAEVPPEQMGAMLGALAPDDSAGGEPAASGDSAAAGDSSTGDSSTGDSSTGGSSTGDGATGDSATGGDTASGGDAAAGDTASGGDATSPDGGGYTEGDMGDLAGQGTMEAGGDLVDTVAAGEVTGEAGSTTDTAANESADQALVEDFFHAGAADWDGVRLGGGHGHYAGEGSFTLTQCNGGACESPTGYFVFNLEIDFDAMTYGGSNSGVFLSAEDAGTGVSVSDSLEIGYQSFADFDGAAVITQASSSGDLKAEFTLLSFSGVADAVDAAVTYDNGLTSGEGFRFAGVELIPDEPVPTDWASVQAIPSGRGYWAGGGELTLTACNSGACGSPQGFFNFILEVDFSAQTIGGGQSGGSVFAYDPDTGAAIDDSLVIASVDYSALAGGAGGSATSDSTFFTLNYSLQDGFGTADILGVTASYADGSTSGSGEAFGSLNSIAEAAGGSSDWSGVQAMPAGSGQYAGGGEFILTACNGGTCADPSGFFTFLLNIDFAKKVYGGGGSGAYVYGTDAATAVEIADSLTISEQYFGGLTGPAEIGAFSGSGHFSLAMTLVDVNGVGGLGLDAAASYSDGLNSGAGSASTTFELAQTAGANSTWEALNGIGTGAGSYSGAGNFDLTQCNGTACGNPSGFFSFILNIDFGARTFGGGGSGFFVSASDPATGVDIQHSIDIDVASFADNFGDAAFTTGDGGPFSADFLLKDVGSLAGAGLEVTADYNDGSTIGSGFASAGMANADGATLYSGLQAVASGSGLFAGGGNFLLTNCAGSSCGVDQAGFFQYILQIDFSNQTIGGTSSGAQVFAYDPGSGVSIADQLSIAQFNYGAFSGPVAFNSGNGSFAVDFTLMDVNGVAAGGLDAAASYFACADEFCETSISGSGESSSSFLDAAQWSQLQGITAGKGQYQGSGNFQLFQCNGGSCGSPTGFFNYLLEIDFAAATIGGGSSGASLFASDDLTGTAVSDMLFIPGTDFSQLSGGAGLSAASDSGFFVADFTLLNVNGTGDELAVASKYDDGASFGLGVSFTSLELLTQETSNVSDWAGVNASWSGGTGHYSGGADFMLTQCQGGACSNPSGSFSFLLDIDFDNRTFGGGGSGAFVYATDGNTSTSVGDSLSISLQDFSALSGAATISETSSSGFFGLDLTLTSVAGVDGLGLEAAAAYNDGSTMGDGSASTVFELNQELTVTSDWGAIQAIPQGAGVYSGGGPFALSQCSGQACVAPDGFFSFFLNVDFGARTYGGSGSGAFVYAADEQTSTVISDTIDIAEISFNGYSGAAQWAEISGSGNFGVDFWLKDAGGVAAAGLEVVANYNDLGTIGNGSASAGMAQADGVSLWSGVQAIPAGTGNFSGSGDFLLAECNSGPCTAPTGSFGYLVNIDFANQTFGGNGSGAWIQASDADTGIYISENFDIYSQNYGGSSGVAKFIDWYYSDYENAWIDFTLKDFNGNAAGVLEAKAYFDDWNGTTGYGTSQANRQDLLDWTAVQGIAGGSGWLAGGGDFHLGYCSGSQCQNPTGSFHYGLFIDFGAKTYGGFGSGAGVQASEEASQTSISDSIVIDQTDFSALTGGAHILATNFGGSVIDFSLKDVGNVAALGADVTYYFNDGWVNTGWGSSSASLADAPVILDGTSSWDDVRTIHVGTGQYQGSGFFNLSACEGGACVATGPNGTFDFDLNVDFGRRTYLASSNMGAFDDNLTSSGGSISDSVSVSGGFSGLGGDAAISGVSTSGNYSLQVNLKNLDGQAAAMADAAAAYSDGLGTVGSGAVTDVAVCPGGCGGQ